MSNSDDIECPYCESIVEFSCEGDYSDWLYKNELYQEIKVEVKCPACSSSFWVKSWSTFAYDTAKNKEEL